MSGSTLHHGGTGSAGATAVSVPDVRTTHDGTLELGMQRRALSRRRDRPCRPPLPALPSELRGCCGMATPRGYPSAASWLIQARSTTGCVPSPHALLKRHARTAPLSRRWWVDATYLKIGKRWHELFGAIDEHGQIVDGSVSPRRDRAAAQAFFQGARATSTVPPSQVTTDKANCSPPAVRAVLPTVEHRTSNYLNNRLERDHQHLKGRIRPMRRFKTTGSASTLCRGHALIRNLGRGFSSHTAKVAPRLRLARAWSALATLL